MNQESIKNQMVLLQIALYHLNTLHKVVIREKNLNNFRSNLCTLAERAYLATSTARDHLDQGLVKNIDINYRKLNYSSPIALVEPNYEGATPRQMPIWLKIDFSANPINVWAETRDYCVEGQPQDEYDGHTKVFQLPDNVDASELIKWAKDKLDDRIKIIADNMESPCEDKAKYTERAQTALLYIERACSFSAPVHTYDGLMSADIYVSDANITAKTTNDEIIEMADYFICEAKNNNTAIDGSIEDALFQLRKIQRGDL